MRTALVAGALLLLPFPLAACLWDYDTLAAESRGLPDVIRVITGRFERNPPLYYEMRLDRAARRVEADPLDLPAYDDAAVACDRLGRGDEAIAWMEKKREQLDRSDLPPSLQGDHLRDHRYRYLANAGTFWVHRWIRSGADRAKIDEVQKGRDLIARAIEINPDAHFGRETYQLQAMDWIIDRKEERPDSGFHLPPLLDFERPENRGRKPVEGLAGLIALGDAWQSVDVFNTLAYALKRDGERSSVAYLARLRADELIEAGRTSMDPAAPKEPEALKEAIRLGYLGNVVGGPKDEEDVRAAFRALRKNADQWHERRTAFLLAGLKQGRHPDTDKNFWNGYEEVPPLSIPQAIGRPAGGRRAFLAASWRPAFEWTVFSALGLCVAWLVWTRMIRKGHRVPTSGPAAVSDPEPNGPGLRQPSVGRAP